MSSPDPRPKTPDPRPQTLDPDPSPQTPDPDLAMLQRGEDEVAETRLRHGFEPKLEHEILEHLSGLGFRFIIYGFKFRFRFMSYGFGFRVSGLSVPTRLGFRVRV